MKDIAARAGCSVSTVSRALRGDTRISATVRERVRAAAEELGYQWDRQASRLMAGFRAKATGREVSGETVALVHARPTRYDEQNRLGFWSALTEAAHGLGLRIDEFVLDQRVEHIGKSGRRLSGVLKARGIRGVILFPFYEPDIRHWELDWDAFALVAVGSCPDFPGIDRVVLSDYENGLMCLREMAALGYRRIGLTSSAESERHTAGAFVGAYHYFCDSRADLEPCPVLRLTNHNQQPTRQAREAFLCWFKEHRPDAILTFHFRIREWLAEINRQVPRDVGLATVWPHEDWAGTADDSDILMRPAIEHLHLKLWTNALGPSPHPRRLMIRSPWNPGQTLRKTSRTT